MDKAHGKWGYGLGNGTGLTINESENGETVTFQMHPELFNDSYLPTLLVGAQRIDDQTIENMRWISFISARQTLVSLTVIDTRETDPDQTRTGAHTMNQTQYYVSGRTGNTIVVIPTPYERFMLLSYDPAANTVSTALLWVETIGADDLDRMIRDNDWIRGDAQTVMLPS